MKFKLNDIEIQNILEMHAKMKKKLVKEQAVTPEQPVSVKDQLQKILDHKCIPFGTVVEMDSKNPNFQFAIEQESTTTPGRKRYLFIDKSAYLFEGGKWTKLSTKWSCVTKPVQEPAKTPTQEPAKKPNAQGPESVERAKKIEITGEQCKTAIGNLYNHMISPKSYPLTDAEINSSKQIAEICAEPANRKMFRFGMNKQLNSIARKYGIEIR